MTAREIAEWRVYAGLEMLPNERTEFLLAVLTTQVINATRGEDSDPVEVLDLMPWLWIDAEEPEPRSQADMAVMIEALNKAFGGRDERAAGELHHADVEPETVSSVGDTVLS
jgi:hypothetical protein